jgi:hypothetical protein
MLSPNPILRCGNTTLPIEAFVHLDDVRRGWVRPEKRYLDNLEAKTRFLIQASPFCHVLTDYPESKPKARAGVTPLAEYVHLCDRFYATDPRDNIYGLLGLATPSDVQFLAPDYSQSVATVCRFRAPFCRGLTLPFGMSFLGRDSPAPLSACAAGH